jgi:uncharacterized LabA/DUF88 family protein
MAAATPSPPVWVAVLLDWQNIYNCAREAFQFEGASPFEGTVYPLNLATHLAGGVGSGRSLQELRIYRGRPDNAKDRRSYDAWQSQTAAWKGACGDRLIPRYRDLRYRGDEVTEKGIDVWLAIDLVKIAMERTADRVVVVSSDTDLVPALELAVELAGEEFVEVAGWDGPGDVAAILDVSGVTKHTLTRAHYDRFRDETDYSVGVRIRRKRAPTSSWDSQIQAEGRRRRDQR